MTQSNSMPPYYGGYNRRRARFSSYPAPGFRIDARAPQAQPQNNKGANPASAQIRAGWGWGPSPDTASDEIKAKWAQADYMKKQPPGGSRPSASTPPSTTPSAPAKPQPTGTDSPAGTIPDPGAKPNTAANPGPAVNAGPAANTSPAPAPAQLDYMRIDAPPTS